MTPPLATSLVVAGILDVLLAIGLVLVVRRRLGVAWKVFGLGALAFAVSQIFIRIPIVTYLGLALKDDLEASTPLRWVWLTGLSLTAGLFEETARLIVFRKWLKNEPSWSNAVGLGAGHGALEAGLLVGVLQIITGFTVAFLFSDAAMNPELPAAALAKIEEGRKTYEAMRWWEPLLGTWERVIALGIHVSLSVVVLQAVIRRNLAWYWGAVGYHALSNFVAVLVMKRAGAVWAEVVLTVFLAVSVWVTFRLRGPTERLTGAPTEPVSDHV